MIRLLLAVGILVGAVAVAATSMSGRPLSGTLQLRGATIVDAPPDEPQNTHAAFLIQGEAARLLYEAMIAQPREDKCLVDGSVRKTIGNMACIRLARERGYECDFAIDMKHQTIEIGRVC